MKTYAIILIAFGSLIAFGLILWCLCKIGGRKKKSGNARSSVTTSAPQRQPQTYRDVELGQGTRGSATKNGGMVVLAGAGAAVATAAVVTSLSSGGSGGGGGVDSGGGDGDGGGDGGGGCGGGCGGCGGGCGGCGG